MASTEPASTPTHRVHRTLLLGLLVTAVIAAGLGSQRLTASSSPSSSSSSPARTWVATLPFVAPPEGPGDGAPDEADGGVADHTTAFDDEVPGVANLDPALLGALRRATLEAAEDGIELTINSGWRSPAYQEALRRAAVAEHGPEEAARWVATPETSAHVSGDAVDVGPPEAASWLSAHGDDHGLCPIYDNEPWHYELRLEAIPGGCPPTYRDPTEDPRMQGA